jgi:site-specific DNA recombinase
MDRKLTTFCEKSLYRVQVFPFGHTILCPAGAALTSKPAGVRRGASRKDCLMTAPVRAVAYYRMSDDRQENSIERQRSQVEPYATRHGYAVVRDYTDEGIAGDEERRRKAFLAMLDDARRKRFDVILCDDKDRFGRFDSITMGYYVKPLRDAGVRLETVAQGRVDWSSFAGRITDAVLQEAKKLESQANSRRVMTRLLMMARQGKYTGGPAPHGMRYVPDETFGKRLVAGYPAHVRAVRFIFDWYDRGRSLDAIAAELYARAVPSPTGQSSWSRAALRKILRNRKYTGDATWNTQREGKYTDFCEGEVRVHDFQTARGANPLSDWIIVPDVHEAIIARDLFERVQARLEDNRQHTTPIKNGGDWLLSGLLVCGRCGWRLVGRADGPRRYYRCGRFVSHGRRGCVGISVPEPAIVGCLVRKIQETFLNADNLARLRDELRRQAEAADAGKPGQLGALRKRVAELETKIDEGNERLADIDRDLLPDFMAKLRSWKAERDRLTVEAARLEGRDDRREVEETLTAAEAWLSRLREALGESEPCHVRAVIRELVSKVVLDFQTTAGPKRDKTVCTGGTIYVREQAGLDLSGDSVLLVNGDQPTLRIGEARCRVGSGRTT